MAALAIPAAAQDYEDDIYYNPDKAKKTAPAPVKKQTSGTYITGSSSTYDYPAADTYTPAAGSGLQMSVDEYNRHVPATATDSMALNQAEADADFAYTRRIERFHNPDIIVESGDDELAEYYYATEQPTVINVNVIDLDPWNWWGPSWNWRYTTWYSPFWTPYYNWGWGPSWSWSWNWGWGGWYDPYWSWAGAWGPGWGWGPAWHPGHHHHGWNGNHHAWRPSSPGASRPHRPATGSGIASTHRPGNHGHASAIRPGSSGRPSTGYTTTGRGRFGNRPTGIGSNRTIGTGVRPGAIQRSNTAGSNRRITNGTINTGNRRAIGTGSNTSRRSTGTTYRNSNSYNSSSRQSHSTGSFNTGRSHSGGFGGGGHSGGGGSHGGGGGRGRR